MGITFWAMESYLTKQFQLYCLEYTGKFELRHISTSYHRNTAPGDIREQETLPYQDSVNSSVVMTYGPMAINSQRAQYVGTPRNRTASQPHTYTVWSNEVPIKAKVGHD